jgi:hypothetical protein
VGVRHGLHRPCNRELEGGGVQQQLRRAPEHRSGARPSSGLNELLFRGKFLKRWGKGGRSCRGVRVQLAGGIVLGC